MALSNSLTEFTCFQRLPLELQCKVWNDHPIVPRMLPANIHTRPNGRGNLPAEGAYGVQRFARIPEIMLLCRSAWFAYRLHYQRLHLEIHPGRPFIGIYHPEENAGDIFRFNPKRDVLSTQYQISVSPTTYTRQWTARVWAQRRIVTVQRVGRNIISNGPTPPLFPNLLRHLHIDLLSRVDSLQHQTSDPSTSSASLFVSLARLLSAPARERANLRTITVTITDPQGSRGMFRLVATQPGLPEPHWHQSGDLRGDGAYLSVHDLLRTGRGAIFHRPPYTSPPNEEYAFLAVIESDTCANARGDDDVMDWEAEDWNDMLVCGTIQHRIRLSNPASVRGVAARLRGAIHQDGEPAIDGICAPNYGMEEAEVF